MRMDELIRNALAAARAEGIPIEDAPVNATDDALLAGLLSREPGAPPSQIAQLQAQIAELQRQQRQQSAERFAETMIRDRRAIASQRTEMIAEYVQAAEDDEANPIPQAQSAAINTSRVARLERSYSTRPQHVLSGEYVGSQALIALAANAGEDKATEKNRLLKLTPVGRRVLAHQGGR